MLRDFPFCLQSSWLRQHLDSLSGSPTSCAVSASSHRSGTTDFGYSVQQASIACLRSKTDFFEKSMTTSENARCRLTCSIPHTKNIQFFIFWLLHRSTVMRSVQDVFISTGGTIFDSISYALATQMTAVLLSSSAACTSDDDFVFHFEQRFPQTITIDHNCKGSVFLTSVKMPWMPLLINFICSSTFMTNFTTTLNHVRPYRSLIWTIRKMTPITDITSSSLLGASALAFAGNFSPSWS